MATTEEMLRACETAAKTPLHRGGTPYNDWERKFLSDIREYFDEVGELTEKQLAKLVELWERS